MPDIHCTYAQITPNQIAEGFYTVENSLLTMVFGDGSPVILPDGSHVTHHLDEGENAKQVAGRLTKQIRKALMGEQIEGFSNPINYPNTGIA